MREVVLGLVVGVTLLACSSPEKKASNGSPSGGMAGSGAVAGTGAAQGGSSAPGGSGGAGGTSGTAGAAGSGGASPFSCTQFGTECQAGTECYIDQHADGTFSSACAPAGSTATGMPCTASSDCVPEYYCGATGTCMRAPGCCWPTCESCSGLPCAELAAGTVQVGAICATGCSSGDSCPTGMTCVASRCVYGTVGAEGEACIHTLGCAAGLTCTVGGTCARACEEDVDCLAGERCSGLATDDVSTFATGLSYAFGVCVTPCMVSGSGCPEGRCYGDLLSELASGEDTGICGKAGTAAKNEPCAGDEDCGPDLVCLGGGSAARCRSLCLDDAGCAAEETCLSTNASSAGACVPSCNFATGEGCTTGFRCYPVSNPMGSVSPGCVSGQGTTCVGADCSTQLGDTCERTAICHEGTCRKGCLTDADCTDNDACGSLGTACTGMISQTVRFCE